MKKKAFTLSETLIALVVIGIVAALTIPALIENHNQKALNTAREVFLRRFQEATKQMNTDGKMTGYSTTEDFVNTFKNYMKNIQICETGNFGKCFTREIKVPTEVEMLTIETNELKTAENFKKEFNTNIIGFVLSNGASMLMAYDPSCEYIDPYNSNADTTKCISMVYDVNGKKGPNEQSKDIFTLGGVQLSVTCKKYYEPLDMTLACEDTPYQAINTCDGSDGIKYDDMGSNNSSCNENRWAGAQKACSEIGMRVPTRNELNAIASYVYNVENMTNQGGNFTIDSNRMNELGMQIQQIYWSDQRVEKGMGCSPVNESAYAGFFARTGYSNTCYWKLGSFNLRCIK